ncbi:MAG TPA: dihydrolipoamide acetyltransferase family protein [Anaerolineaceae bacterium]|nr:dihydrolipoamide acetyltransferase family protein [Anaerolineaceae bacterium]
MPTPFIMPKMDMDQEVVTIISWLKKEGERIEKGEPVIEVETDKITSEIEAPESGILAGILYQENEEAPVTKVVAYILKEGESMDSLPAAGAPAAPQVAQPAAAPVPAQPAKPAVPATPLAEKVSADLHIKLDQVPASGPKVTRKDVESFAESLKEQGEHRVQTPATPAARRLSGENGVPLDAVSGTGPRGRVQAADVLHQAAAAQTAPEKPFKPASKALPATAVPFVGKRKRIAERLTASYQSIPHIFLTVEVDMSAAEAARKRVNQLAEKQGKPAVSVTAFLVKTVAWALKRHPYLNATLQDDKIQLLQDVNIGVATALEDGLIVPVIQAADQLSLAGINEHLRYLTAQARAGALTAEEVAGGTFTISNLGMFGISSFTAIINPPQSAILAVGTVTRKPVVVDENDTIAVRPIMNLTLSADHRLVDGAVAAAFLADLVSALEAPELVLY